MADAAEATFLFLKVSGDQAVQSASDVIAKLIAGIVPAQPSAMDQPPAAVERLPGPAVAEETAPAPKRLGRPRKVRYHKSADEPDGFNAPPPAQTKAVGIDRPMKRGLADGQSVGDRIVHLLGTTNGVAPMEVLVQKLALPPQSIGRAVGHSDELKRMPDGRVALESYEDDD